MIKQSLPFNEEAENAVLGACLIDKEAVASVCSIISEEVFYNDANLITFRCIKSLWAKDMPIDFVTVVQNLKKNSWVAKAGGAYRLTELTRNIASSANVEYHCRILIELYAKRKTIQLCNEASREAYDPFVDPFELLSSTGSKILSIQEMATRGATQTILDAVLENSAKRDATAKGIASGIQTPYPGIDKLIGGLEDGKLLIVAARTAMGKTAFALNLLHCAAVAQGRPSAFFSLEMGAVELVSRLVSIDSGIGMERIKCGLSDAEKARIFETDGRIGDSPIFINDSASMNIDDLRAYAVIMKKKHAIEILFVDYLQLLSPTRTRNTTTASEIGEISRKLKVIAKELNIPVVALAQLSRAIETRQDKTPQLSDLRDSGSIEQDADIVIMLYRPEYYQIDQVEDGELGPISTQGLAYICVKKNRSGSTGEVPLLFEGSTQRFKEFTNKF